MLGDHINPLMAVYAWSLKQWLLAIFWLLSTAEQSINFRKFMNKRECKDEIAISVLYCCSDIFAVEIFSGSTK